MEKLLLPEEVAEIARVDVQTVRRWLRSGELKGTKVGRGWRVKESDLQQFLEGKK